MSGAVAIATTIALVEQFLASLAPDTQHDVPPSANTPSPLILLAAAVKSLKAQVTKLSLLTVTTPFTPSAVSTCLQAVNDSVLPSLVTETLLTSVDAYTPSFANECRLLTRGALRDFQTLTKLVETRSKDGKLATDMPEWRKKEVTEATGRVWESCDKLINFADGGLPGFVVRKAKQWLDLMKDAVKELQEWDPAEELDDADFFGDVGSDDEDDAGATTNGEPGRPADGDRVTISAGVKDQALKVLSRIPQSVHVVVRQRLEKLQQIPDSIISPDARTRLNDLLVRTRTVSELIDESAEGMYMGDLELCLKKAGEARALTIEIIEGVLEPFEEASSQSDVREETQQDKYVKRALEWIRQVDTVKDLPRR